MKKTQFELNAELEEIHWWFVARRTILTGLLHEIRPPGLGHRVVDLGCGTGANIASLAGDYQVTGFDVSEDALAFARQRFPEVDFREGEGTEFLGTLDEAEAPVILLTDVLEHIEFEVTFFRRVFEAAPAGTIFLITVPADPALWSPHDVSHGHFRRYTRETLTRVWDDLDARVRLLSYYNSRLYPVVRFIRFVTRYVDHSFGRGSTDLTMPPVGNSTLRAVFASELKPLLGALRSGQSTAFRRGVSLIAVLEKGA